MANALEMQNKFYTQSTRTFIRYINRVFDCLNVSKIGVSVKDDLRPYRDINDERYKVFLFLNKGYSF